MPRHRRVNFQPIGGSFCSTNSMDKVWSDEHVLAHTILTDGRTTDLLLRPGRKCCVGGRQVHAQSVRCGPQAASDAQTCGAEGCQRGRAEQREDTRLRMRAELNLRVLAVAAENESAINRPECSSYVASAFLFLAPPCTRPCPATLLAASAE